jgi:ribosomal protein S18 acetylase RimI-like enzyme
MHPAPVVRLSPSDAERFARFRERMLREAPWAFAATPEDDVALDPAYLGKSLAESENAILAIEEAGTLVASAGIVRMKSPKFAHRAKLWGVFVDAGRRGCGLGRRVTAAAVDLARTWDGVDFVDLGVSANSPEARRLYESLGFTVWGREPETTQYGGQRYDEIYMSLRVDRRAGGGARPAGGG